jgi:hypothetical protein
VQICKTAPLYAVSVYRNRSHDNGTGFPVSFGTTADGINPILTMLAYSLTLSGGFIAAFIDRLALSRLAADPASDY